MKKMGNRRPVREAADDQVSIKRLENTRDCRIKTKRKEGAGFILYTNAPEEWRGANNTQTHTSPVPTMYLREHVPTGPLYPRTGEQVARAKNDRLL